MWRLLLLLVAGAVHLWASGHVPDGYQVCSRCGRLVADENVVWINGHAYGPSCARM